MRIARRPGRFWSVVELVVSCAGWGAWIAAGAMVPSRRRLARAGVLALVVGAAKLGPPVRESKEPRPPAPVEAKVAAEEAAAAVLPGSRRKLVLLASLAVTIEVVGFFARRRLESWLLGRLQRGGDAHPHRTLGLRWAAVCFAIGLPLQLQRHQPHRPTPSDE